MATVASAIAVLTIQVLALTTLEAEDFGHFSFGYLAFAFANSLSLSIVSEAWLRRNSGSSEVDRDDYMTVLTYLSAGAGLLSAVILALVAATPIVAGLSGAAVALSTLRSGARFNDSRLGRWRRVVAADAACVIGTVAAWAISNLVLADPLMSVIIAWAAGAAGAAALTRPWTLRGPATIGTWVRRHRPEITVLLRDSLVLDASSIGTPYAVAGMLGIAQFGIFRAVSNVAAPVRLLLNPLRPLLPSAHSGTPRRAMLNATVIGASIVFGLGAYGALLLIAAYWPGLGTLAALAPFAIPTGIFVAANVIGTYHYIVARTMLSGRRLLIGRTFQTIATLVGTLVPAALDGLGPAIWGFVAASALSAMLWMLLVGAGEQSRGRADGAMINPQE